MSDPGDFLARWSRRKRAAADEAAPATAATESSKPKRAPADTKAVETTDLPGQPATEPFDPATLPSIESITAVSDVRAFLAPGVPAELTRAALRRMWAADPKIRDFVGLAEYAWDFNATGSMHGFGPLEMTDALRTEIARMFSPEPTPEIAAEGATGPSPQPALVAEEFTTEQSSLELSAQVVAQDQEAIAKDELPANPDMTQRNKESIALQRENSKDDDAASTVPRRHGSALPK